jgi:hypothetical protein
MTNPTQSGKPNATTPPAKPVHPIRRWWGKVIGSIGNAIGNAMDER